MAENKTTTKVTAARDFYSVVAGNRAEGEEFEYDLEKDPADLVKLGLLKGGKAEAAQRAAQQEAEAEAERQASKAGK